MLQIWSHARFHRFCFFHGVSNFVSHFVSHFVPCFVSRLVCICFTCYVTLCFTPWVILRFAHCFTRCFTLCFTHCFVLCFALCLTLDFTHSHFVSHFVSGRREDLSPPEGRGKGPHSQREKRETQRIRFWPPFHLAFHRAHACTNKQNETISWSRGACLKTDSLSPTSDLKLQTC